MKRTDILLMKKEIKEWIAKKTSKSEMCRVLKCRPSTLNAYLLKMKIEYQGNKGGKGQGGKKRDIRDYLKKNGPFINSHYLKIRLIEERLKKRQCEKCLRKKWLSKPISLELHHVDGDKNNNILKNLKLFCPNCHSMTNNNSGKANKRR